MKIIKYLLVLALILQCALSSELSKEFDAKPQGNKENVELVLGDYKCEFSYTATGGTNENWLIHIEEESDQVLCVIGRPNPPKSYLLIHDFSASLTNTKAGKQPQLIAEVNDNEGSILMGDQFKIVNNNKVVPDKNFGKNIVLVQLILKK